MCSKAKAAGRFRGILTASFALVVACPWPIIAHLARPIDAGYLTRKEIGDRLECIVAVVLGYTIIVDNDLIKARHEMELGPFSKSSDIVGNMPTLASSVKGCRCPCASNQVPSFFATIKMFLYFLFLANSNLIARLCIVISINISHERWLTDWNVCPSTGIFHTRENVFGSPFFVSIESNLSIHAKFWHILKSGLEKLCRMSISRRCSYRNKIHK